MVCFGVSTASTLDTHFAALTAKKREFMEMVQTSKMGPFVDTLKGGDNGNMVLRKVPFESEIFSDCTDHLA